MDRIEREEEEVSQFISDNSPVREPDPDDWDLDDVGVPDEPERDRTIFDDIDEE